MNLKAHKNQWEEKLIKTNEDLKLIKTNELKSSCKKWAGDFLRNIFCYKKTKIDQKKEILQKSCGSTTTVIASMEL